ncbi:X-ray repair cross-complementing protein 5 [Apodemus speciosus]|uniref:X-ray repair cross-complementing protein 5 n=1 Tax=Apodemus speciosus TaxID=105296 RepID=A0ABQ0EDN8_APOSI
MAAVVLCVDVGVAMGNSFPGEESPIEQAKKVMTMFVQRQVFSESKDEIALVLYGTEGTHNALAGEDQYQNITVHRHLMLPDFDLLEDIGNKIQPSSQQADLGKKFGKKHIEVFTDLSSPFSQDQLDIIMCNLKKSGISLQFFLPFPIDKNGEPGERGDCSSILDHCAPSFPQKGLTEQQKEGVRMVRRVMLSLEGEDGLDEIYSFRGIVQEKFKKSWIVVDARTLKKEDIQKETVYCLNDDDETEVSKEDTIQGYRYGSDIIPFSKVDEEQMKYKSEGKCFSVLGFCKSSQRKELKKKQMRSAAQNHTGHALLNKPQAPAPGMVHRRFFMGYQVLKVFAAKDDEAAAVALSSLIHALDELNMVAIVRYAYDKRANPQVGVAFPYIKDAYECLVYVQLPFMEDLRQYMFSSLKNNKKCTPTDQAHYVALAALELTVETRRAQLSAIDDLIDSMSLVKKNEEEDIIEDLFPTSKIPNPEFQRLYQCLLHRALHLQEPLPPIQQHILNMLDPPTEMKAKCEIPLSKVKTLFPLTEVVKKKNQVTAQDVFQDKLIICWAHEEGPAAKKYKTEEEEGLISISSLAEGNVTKVGSVNPVDNFRVLIRQKIASFEEAIHFDPSSLQLTSVIEQFLDTNETLYFMKSMDCIKAFREEAIQFSEEKRFNSFLEALREKVEIKQLNHFWEIVVQDGVTLITKDEGPGSAVTAEEATKFLAPRDKAKEDAAELEEGGDVDDLLDMI